MCFYDVINKQIMKNDMKYTNMIKPLFLFYFLKVDAYVRGFCCFFGFFVLQLNVPFCISHCCPFFIFTFMLILKWGLFH